MTTESRGFIRRTCAPIGDLRPRGSSPNMKALLRFGSAPSSGSSLSGASASGAPLGQRPTILADSHSSSARSLACWRRYWRKAATRVWSLRKTAYVPLWPALRLGYWGYVMEFVLVPHDELAGLERHLMDWCRECHYPRRPDGRCHPRNRTYCASQPRRVHSVAI